MLDTNYSADSTQETTSQGIPSLKECSDNDLIMEVIVRCTEMGLNLTGADISQMLKLYADSLPTDCRSRYVLTSGAEVFESDRKYKLLILNMDSDNNPLDTDITIEDWLWCYAGSNRELLEQQNMLINSDGEE